MASRTRYHNLTKLGSGEDVHTEGFGSTDRDVIDQALYAAFRHHHAGDVFTAPEEAPDLFLENDGTLPAGTRVRYSYTWTHPDLGESRMSPIGEITTPAAIADPAAPTAALTTIGGNLPPGQYYYVLSAYQNDTYTETKATNPVQVTIPTGTSTNAVTITATAVPAGATGYNLYRRGPGDTRYHFIASGDVTQFVDAGTVVIPAESINVETFLTTEAGSAAVVQPPSGSRTIPTTNTTNGNSSVVVDVTGEIPAGYTWSIYRTTANSFADSLLVADLAASVVTYEDIGAATTDQAPPTTQLFQQPDKVLLTEGAEVQGFLPAEMVAVDDTNLATKGDTLDVILNGLDSALDPTTMGLTIGTVGSGAMFECDGTNDQVQFKAAFDLANTAPYANVINVHRGTYNFDAGCVVANTRGVVLRAMREEMFAPYGFRNPTVLIVGRSWTQPLFTITSGDFFVQGIEMYFSGTANSSNQAPGASMIDANSASSLVLEGCQLTPPYYGNATSTGIRCASSAVRIVDCVIYSQSTKSFIDVRDGAYGFISRNYIEGGGQNGIFPPLVALNHAGSNTNYDYSPLDISDNWSDGWSRPLVEASGFTSLVRISGNRLLWGADDEDYSAVKVTDSSRIDIVNNMFDNRVEVLRSRDVRVVGNSIYESPLDGVLITDSVDCTVTNNSIVDIGWGATGTYSGIRLTGTSSGNIITDNMVREYTTTHTLAAILIADATCVGNEVRGNNIGTLDLADNGTDTYFGMLAYLGIVDHGGDPAALRPNLPGPVLWRGTVEPANAIDGDDWLDFSPGSSGAIDGGTL